MRVCGKAITRIAPYGSSAVGDRIRHRAIYHRKYTNAAVRNWYGIKRKMPLRHRGANIKYPARPPKQRRHAQGGGMHGTCRKKHPPARRQQGRGGKCEIDWLRKRPCFIGTCGQRSPYRGTYRLRRRYIGGSLYVLR